MTAAQRDRLSAALREPERLAPPNAAPAQPEIDPRFGEEPLKLTQDERREVQAALNALGFDAGPADGVFGQRTRQALAAYQRDAGLPVTGYLTAAQWDRLSAALRELAPPVPFKPPPPAVPRKPAQPAPPKARSLKRVPSFGTF